VADDTRFALTPEENEKIFQEDIKPYLLATATPGITSSDAPVMVMVGGQPGAGKSRSIASVRLDLEKRGGVMEIAADDLRKFHPKHDALMRADDRTAASFTHADASLWAEKAERFARSQRMNVLLEGTMKTPENTATKIAEYRQDGYFVEARVIAATAMTSWQGAVSRYEQQKAIAGAGRWCPKEVHDAAVAGVSATVRKLEEERAVDRLRIDRRGAEQIYSNALKPDGQWHHQPAGARVLDNERNRPPTARQLDEYVATWDKVAALQDRPERNATATELQEVERLRREGAAMRDAALLRERDAAAAAALRYSAPKEAVAQHPRLAGAYGALQAMDQRAQAQGLDDRQRSVVVERARELMAMNIEKGRYPAVDVRDQRSERSESQGKDDSQER